MTMSTSFARFEQSVRERMQPLLSQARSAWKQRTPREQRLLRGGALLLLVALIWLIGLQPALNRVQSAQNNLPVMQAQASQLNGIILESQALGRGHSGALSVEETAKALQASLSNAGLDGLSVFTEQADSPSSETRWRIEFTQAPARRIVDWLAGLSFVVQVQTRQVDLARSNIDGRERAGQLSGVVVLALPLKEDS